MACGKEAISEEYLQFIVDYELTAEEIAATGVNFCNVEVAEGISIIYITRGEFEKIQTYLRRYPYIPKCYGLMQQSPNETQPFSVSPEQANLQPLDATGIIRIQNSPLSLTGLGVMMGFADTGIRYTLPHFRNPDGTTRILAIWDQTLSADELNLGRERIMEEWGVDISYAPPEGYDYGVLFTNEQINLALASDAPYEIVPTTDENGHGTKVASVACGSIIGATGFRGASYDSEIVVVKLRQSPQYLRDYYFIPDGAESFSDPDIMLALKFIQGFAQTFRKPLSICFSLGTSSGNHTGDSLLAKYLDVASQKRSQVIVIAGGNEGNAAGHFRGEIPLNSIQNWVDVELLIGENEKGIVFELWGQLPDIFTVEITSPAGEFIQRIPYRVNQSVSYRFVYSNTLLMVNYIAVEQASGQELILFRLENPLAGIWKIRVYAEGESGFASFDMWLPIAEYLSGETAFLRPDPDTTLTEPAYSREALSVSTYQSANNSFYLNSGRGFAADGFIQPDLSAPGVGISTALGGDSGSSLAAAITSGAVADFLQWAVVERNDILINTQSMRNYLVRGAGRDEKLSYPSKTWGYGRLDMSATFDKIAGVIY